MGAMEKKRLLPALIVTVVSVSWAAVSSTQDSVSLQGIRTKPEEAELARTKNFLGDSLEPDMPGAEKAISDMKNNRLEEQTEQIMKLLSVNPGPEGVFPEENAAPQKERPKLFYFFSFSMPHSSLREAARESAVAGAVMVLRGLSGEGLGETALRIQEIIGKTGTEVWIDPLLFECFSVGAAPQLVLAYGHLEGAQCNGLRHVKLSGDVSLPYALGLMEKEDANAGMFTERLEKSGFYRD